MAAITILLAGSIPLTSTGSFSNTPDGGELMAPYAGPTVMITSIFHAACASYTYGWYLSTGQTIFAVGMGPYAGLASIGLWCLLFASGSSGISRRTGVDKRMTGFPFKNVEADKKRREKKKER